MRAFSVIIFLLLFAALPGYGQQNLQLKIKLEDKEEGFLGKKYKLKDEFESDLEVERALQSLVFKLYGDGYVTASIDSISKEDNVRIAHLFVGNQYQWEKLSTGNVEDQVLKEIGYKEKFFSETTFDFNRIDELLEEVMTYYEDNGFPFARVKMDSVVIEENSISASLHVDEQQMILFDTLSINGDTKISKRYLYNYLGIKPDRLYDESTIRKISKRIEELPFLVEEKPFEVLFLENKARVNLHLADKKASQFDFLLGILPNNKVTGRVLITGEIKLNLVSPFGTGKEIFLNWKRLEKGTQSLDIAFKYPYFLGVPFGWDLGFSLYKKDTLYLDLDYEIGVQYLFVGGNYVKVFVHNKSTNVLNVDTIRVINTRSLPTYHDVRNTLYGVEYYYENFNYRLNPTSGFSTRLKAAAGTRKIKKNSKITELQDPEHIGQTLESLYDTVKLKAVQYKFEYRFEKYWPVKNRATIKTALVGGAIVSNDLFSNELFRIGGTKLLRGFDEEEIFASLYDVGTAEFRFLLSSNSYVNLFFDGAYVEDRSSGQYRNDFPFGFGAGLTFETKAGLFGVSYALGRQQQNPIDFRQGKIHFGYVNYF